MKFSIIVPAYNSAQFINIPLDSLEKQTFQDFEVIVVNDGSTDNTSEIVESYIVRNPHWRLIEKKNGNWGSVINYVKKEVGLNGSFITVLDSDDYYLPTCLTQVNNVKGADLIVTDIMIKDEKKTKTANVFFSKEGILKRSKLRTPLSMPHGKFYSKELFLSMIDLEEGISYQDTVLYNDLATKSKSVFYLKKTLAVWWRTRPGNSTNVAWDQKRIDILFRTFTNNTTIDNVDNEIFSWILMYLWDVKRNIKGKSDIAFPELFVPYKSLQFSWLPYGSRKLAKAFFKSKTKNMWKKI